MASGHYNPDVSMTNSGELRSDSAIEQSLAEIASEIQDASFALNSAHKHFGQVYQSKGTCISKEESKAWNAVVKACDAISEAAKFVEGHGYIVA